eukprot:TRINITY_DN16105_c0_g1_i1.p1 TRINITY_DN16105_c0_g1~~TRINITY_DN16105_c0_g1_i1.p1  ORF type:complete len:306 (+),score=45.61 TRINITY_DN16105_c0_g1_i1:55-972(+)
METFQPDPQPNNPTQQKSAPTSPSISPIFDSSLISSPPRCNKSSFHPYIISDDIDINLQTKWRFWFELPQEIQPLSTKHYLKSLRTSVVLWNLQQIYNFIIDNYGKYQRIFLFKEGINPIWEDPQNFEGGRFFVHCQSEKQAFENFLLVVKTILPRSFIDPDDLCGIIYAFKPPNRFSVSVWHKNSKDKAKIKEIRGHLKNLFNVRSVSYHNHRASIKLSHHQRNNVGMNTYPPKKVNPDAGKFEQSIQLLQSFPQVVNSPPQLSKLRSLSCDSTPLAIKNSAKSVREHRQAREKPMMITPTTIA